MGKMKANRKFKQEDEAVSAVIGVILMVAITVAIAATVYVYVSGMLGTGQQSAPNVAFTKTNYRLTVTKADSNVDWNDLKVSVSGDILITNVTFKTLALGTGGLVTNTDGTYVIAGDYLDIVTLTAGQDGAISMVHVPTNSLIGTWNFAG